MKSILCEIHNMNCIENSVANEAITFRWLFSEESLEC